MSRMYICRLSVKLWQMSSIKRIGPRLQSMAFKMKFQDLVNEIKPVCLCDTLVVLSNVYICSLLFFYQLMFVFAAVDGFYLSHADLIFIAQTLTLCCA